MGKDTEKINRLESLIDMAYERHSRVEDSDIKQETNDLITDLKYLQTVEKVKPLSGKNILMVEDPIIIKTLRDVPHIRHQNIRLLGSRDFPKNLSAYCRIKKISGAAIHIDQHYYFSDRLESIKQALDETNIKILILERQQTSDGDEHFLSKGLADQYPGRVSTESKWNINVFEDILVKLADLF